MAREIHTSLEEAFAAIAPNAATYMVIVSRGLKEDVRVLSWAMGTSPRYIGMIANEPNVLSVYRALENEGVALAEFTNVHVPAGLDIGAFAPEEIAVSITAELIAVRRGAANLAHKAAQLERANPISAD